MFRILRLSAALCAMHYPSQPSCMFYALWDSKCVLGSAFHSGGSLNGGQGSLEVKINRSKYSTVVSGDFHSLLHAFLEYLSSTSLASEQFVKTRVYHTQWTHHIFFEMGGFESPEHCAIWCRIQHECHLFHFDWSNDFCYLGNRNKFINTSGPKSSTQMDVYWDPGKRLKNFIN